MKSSIQIQNEVLDLNEQNEKLSADFNAAEGDAQAAIHDQIVANSARVKALNEQLSEVLAYEDDIRKNGGVPLAAAANDAAKKPVLDIASQFLGKKGEFKTPALGNKVRIEVSDEYTDFGIPEYEIIERNLPPQHDDLPYFGFIDSLPKGTTDADIMTFYERDLSKYVNGAKKWKPGETKGKSSFAWTKRSAYHELIAHYVPVLETELKDEGQLRSIVNNELMYGLRFVESGKALMQEADADDPGIVGVTKTAGILNYTQASGDTVVDSIRKMATDVFLSSGYRPTHVALHPYVAESIQLEKDANGRYIEYMVNGRLYGLRVVEDLNLSETTGTGKDAKTTFGALVYWNGAATWFTKHGNELAVGLVNDQFIKNELTIRAEGEHLLKVTAPKAFSYLKDTGVAGR